ncbi:RAQPRD family integrative conjugative element protein [Stenotrophomonas maltophilia]|uniref:integrative conjugative element protein, RAQPRD family n=1 Tax=Stenotrophomonas maltophilia TaxID=40324 RepID=UPI0013DB1BA3|nr:RAQPRD family integrative conjugative element protein [Stenotrophomonas maltophilia]
MVASIWLRAAHRGVPLLPLALVTVLLLGQSPMARAETPVQRQELAAALRQLDALERTVAHSAAHAPVIPGERYHFDYPRLLADLARVRAGIQAHLTPSRAQPRDPAELAGDYRTERIAEPSSPTTAEGKP